MVSYDQGKKDARDLAENAKDEEVKRLAAAVLALYDVEDRQQNAFRGLGL